MASIRETHFRHIITFISVFPITVIVMKTNTIASARDNQSLATVFGVAGSELNNRKLATVEPPNGLFHVLL